jgi:hypothetical protein
MFISAGEGNQAFRGTVQATITASNGVLVACTGVW